MEGIHEINSTVAVKRAAQGNEVARPGQDDHARILNGSNQGHNDVAFTPENEKLIQKALKALEIFQSHHPDTRFQYHNNEDTGSIQVRLVNFKTGEVVEEIPSSKLLKYAAQLEELSGLVLEERA